MIQKNDGGSPFHRATADDVNHFCNINSWRISQEVKFAAASMGYHGSPLGGEFGNVRQVGTYHREQAIMAIYLAVPPWFRRSAKAFVRQLVRNIVMTDEGGDE